MIQIEKLTKRYGRGGETALQGVSLTIPDGSLFGLLGPNGAGKTTLISILVGLLKPSSGTVRYDGVALEQCLSQVRATTGFVPQELAFYPMLTVAENLDFYVAACGVAKGERAARIERAVAVTRLADHYHKAAHALSGGLKRRLNLAIGLLNEPRILFLDEPTVGIDPQSRNFILDTIAELNRSHGMTVIYTSHYMAEVQQLCDQIAIIDRGRIVVEGPLQPLLDAGARKRLEFSLAQPCDGIAAALQQQFQAQRQSGCDFVIETEDASRLLEPLQQFAAAHGVALQALRFGYGSLESLYLQQTQSSLRE